MSKGKKRIIIILTIIVVLYFLLIGISNVFLSFYVFPGFEYIKLDGAYPYSSAEIPDDFTEYAAGDVKLRAPDCLNTIADTEDICNYRSQDDAQCDLNILVLKKSGNLSENFEWIRNNPHLFNKWLTGRGWLTKLGMKKIGYKLPETSNEMMYLLDKMDEKDYSKFSLIESYTFTKLAILKAIMVPAMLGSDTYDKDHPLQTPLEVKDCGYYLENDSFHAIIRQKCSGGGRYCLSVTFYPVYETEYIRTMIITSDDPDLAQKVFASVRLEK